MDALTVKARAAVDKIIADLSDRRGLRQEWDQIDEQVRDEIKTAWRDILITFFKENKKLTPFQWDQGVRFTGKHGKLTRITKPVCNGKEGCVLERGHLGKCDTLADV